MPNKNLPYLNAALMCEKVLLEKDGSISIIRVADRVHLQIPDEGLPPGVKPMFSLSCLISFKSGPVTGEHIFKLQFVRPSGELQGQPIQQAATLSGNDQGQNFIFPITIGVHEEGLHWVHVSFDDIELTRIPLMVVQMQGHDAQVTS